MLREQLDLAPHGVADVVIGCLPARPRRPRRSRWAVLAVLLSLGAGSHAQTRHGRLFLPQDLGLLEAPDRDAWQRPDQIMDALAIADGAVVADLGAGGGWFTIRLARRVGPNGLVYAEDIQRQMTEAIARRVEREGLRNVRTVLGASDDPRLPAGSVDAVLIVDAYHEIEDPAALLRNVTRALRPLGRLGVVDFTPGAGGPGPPPEERADATAVIRDAATVGLRLLKREDVPPFQYLLVFGKAVGSRNQIAEQRELAATRRLKPPRALRHRSPRALRHRSS